MSVAAPGQGEVGKAVQCFALAAVAATAVGFALPLDEEADVIVSLSGTFVTGIVMIGTLAWAARTNKGGDRMPWALTLAVYALGMLTYALDPATDTSTGTDYSAAMFFGPVAIAAQIGVVAVLARKILAGTSVRTVLVDTLWLGGAALVLSWEAVGAAVLGDSSLNTAEKAVFLAQLVLFAVLVGFVLTLLPRAARSSRRALLVLTSPALLLAIALCAQARAASTAAVGPGTIADLAFPVAFGVGAAAVLHSRAAEQIAPPPAAGGGASQLAASLPLIAWIVMTTLGELEIVAHTSILGLVVLALGLVRFSALVQENRRLVVDLRRRATHDHLTGLPNRAQLAQLIEERGDGPAALLFVDLDRFKTVNDTLGHLAGDQLLVGAAERMIRTAGPGWTVGRLAGDEFVVLGDRVDADLEDLARRLIDALAAPFRVGDREVWVGATVGVATTRDGFHPAELLDAADQALRGAKSSARGEVLTVGTDVRDRARARQDLEDALREGIDRGELFCLYQPKVDLDAGELVGVEALVRWNRPGIGVVAPDEFIGVAESSGLITRVDEWVFRQATDDLARWNEMTSRRLGLSTNMSAWELSRVDVAESVARAIARNGRIAPEQLTIEITETALIEAPEIVNRRLRRIGDLGVRLAIDDFGVGFTAIAYLVDFPVDEVKIDRTLTALLDGSGRDERSLAAAVVALARALDLDVVAEGVETGAQVASLRRLGCRTAQGFHFSKPVLAEEIDRLVVERETFAVATPGRP